MVISDAKPIVYIYNISYVEQNVLERERAAVCCVISSAPFSVPFLFYILLYYIWTKSQQ